MAPVGLIVQKRSLNSADEIQQIAVRNIIESTGAKIDYFYERNTQELMNLAGEKVDPPGQIKIVHSGWYDGEFTLFPPPAWVDPLFISMHVDERVKGSTYDWLERFKLDPPFVSIASPDHMQYFKDHGKIGCRDAHTFQLFACQNNYVEVYLSGCATTTLGRFYDIIPSVNRKGKFVVDVAEAKLKEFFPEYEITNDVSQAGQPNKFVNLTHSVTFNLLENFQAKMDNAATLIQHYRSAELVITTRLHAAIACISFGTPVVYVPLSNETEPITDPIIQGVKILGRDTIDLNDIQNMNNQIDYKYFNEKADNIVEEIIEFLKN